MTPQEKKFESLRRRHVRSAEREQEFRAGLLRKYGTLTPPGAWLTRTEEARLDSFDRVQCAVADEFFNLLDVISPRRWRTGVAMWWIIERLSYADAITSGPLSELPQAGYGSSQREVERFADALEVAA